MRHVLLASLASFVLGCTAPGLPQGGQGALWGYVKLVPKQGTSAGGDSYSDRRVRDAARFDYTHPTFAVVYASGLPAAPQRAASLGLVRRGAGLEWQPSHAALALGGALLITNSSSAPQVVSAPLAGFLRELTPGETATLTPTEAGELEVHALGAGAAPALIWVTPGAFAIADAAGRYELRDLAPGEVEIHAWHPRLPPSVAHTITLRAGVLTRLDLEIGVDQSAGSAP
ncbi:MAG: carboxypeptidase-like regulatory domain-containing protein [Myxococcota bacterium]